MLVSWLEGAPRDDVNPDTQKFLKVLEQPDVIKKRRARLEVDEQVQVAVWTSLASGDGTKHGDPMNLALTRDTQNLRPASAKPLQRQYVSGHPTRVDLFARALAAWSMPSLTSPLAKRRGTAGAAA